MPSWSQTTGKYRAEILKKICNLIREHQEELAKLESTDNGKSLAEAREDMIICGNLFEYYADLAIDLDNKQGERIQSPDTSLICRVRYEPIGVCALICPFNYPALMVKKKKKSHFFSLISIFGKACLKLTPCLAAGCTAVLKPSEITPLSILYLARLFKLAGLPPGNHKNKIIRFLLNKHF